MAESVRISLVDQLGRSLAGTVDIALSPSGTPAGVPRDLRILDASKDIEIEGKNLVAGQSLMSVRPTTGAFQPLGQPITVSPNVVSSFKVEVILLAPPARDVGSVSSNPLVPLPPISRP